MELVVENRDSKNIPKIQIDLLCDVNKTQFSHFITGTSYRKQKVLRGKQLFLPKQIKNLQDGNF